MCKLIKIFLSLFIFFSSIAQADKPAPPSTYKITSPNEQYVFVMIAPLTLEQELSYWIESKQKQILEVRSIYSASGMYRNNGSKDPLWTVDWFSYSVEIANDGSHLVRPGPWARKLEDDAIHFMKMDR